MMSDASLVALFDLGSSRLKWQLRAAAGDLMASGGGDWGDVLQGLHWPPAVPKTVILVAVDGVGPRVEALCQLLRERNPGVHLRRIVSSALGPSGLRLGYDPGQFGADRYAALLGVRAQTLNAAVIVDAGTAVTIDGIRSDGTHIGGYILPGFRLGRESVRGLFSPELQARVEAAAQEGGARVSTEGNPGRDTTGALVTGWTLGLCAAIDDLIIRCARHLDHVPEVWLSGGDAAWIARFLQHPCRLDSDLIFTGLWFSLQSGYGENVF
jgi:type III pantothenate kinase